MSLDIFPAGGTPAVAAGPGIRIERFPAVLSEGKPDRATLAWFEAVRFGFLEEAADPEGIARSVEGYEADGRILWSAYDDAAPEGAWDPGIPVATYGTMDKTLNVGQGRLLPAHLITAVTVRSTHRRRGLLRSLITADLRSAQADGLPLAALTASEATIYGRFGFGTATFSRRIEVDVRERFAVTATPAGRTMVVEPARLLELAPQIFDRFHARTFGSVARQEFYRRFVSGQWQRNKTEPDPAVRVAVHTAEDGTLDGYVSYRFAGWDHEPPTIRVLDLIAGSEAAYVELWRFLGAIDLVEKVTFEQAPADDPLPWALADRRCYQVVGEEDVLWLRVLDVAACLGTRGYRNDGAVTIWVEDALGLAGGVFRLEVAAGTAQVSRLDAAAAADVRMDVAALGSLFLGAVSAGSLAAAGRLDPARPSVIDDLDLLFGPAVAPYCATHF